MEKNYNMLYEKICESSDKIAKNEEKLKSVANPLKNLEFKSQKSEKASTIFSDGI